MSFMTSLAICCDRCRRWVDLGIETKRELRQAARTNGWKRGLGADGSLEDLCPDCVAGLPGDAWGYWAKQRQQ